MFLEMSGADVGAGEEVREDLDLGEGDESVFVRWEEEEESDVEFADGRLSVPVLFADEVGLELVFIEIQEVLTNNEKPNIIR